MIYRRASVMLETMFLTGVLVESGTGVFLWTATRMVVGYLDEGFKTVDLIYKGGECLVGATSPEVGARTRAVSCIDMVFFLGFMEAWGR